MVHNELIHDWCRYFPNGVHVRNDDPNVHYLMLAWSVSRSTFARILTAGWRIRVTLCARSGLAVEFFERLALLLSSTRYEQFWSLYFQKSYLQLCYFSFRGRSSQLNTVCSSSHAFRSVLWSNKLCCQAPFPYFGLWCMPFPTHNWYLYLNKWDWRDSWHN